MKKLFLAFISIAALCAVSCSSDDDNRHNEFTDKGFAMNIHRYVHMQNMTISIDPALVAFRFNVLLATAREQGMDVSEVKVVPKNSTSSMEVTLKNHFFSSNKIEEGEDDNGNKNGVWTLSFSKNSYGSNDNQRIGSIIINTKSKLLEELANGESWDLTFLDGDNGEVYGLYKYYTTHVMEFKNGYSITRSGETAWNVSGTSAAYININTDSKADWNFTFGVTKGNGPDFTYDNTGLADFSMTVDASGRMLNIIYLSKGYSYKTTSPLKFSETCAYPAIVSGACKIGLVEKDITDGGLSVKPDQLEMNVTYQKGPSNCETTAQITFKGMLYTDVI